MRKTGNLRRILSGFFAGVTMLSTVLSPLTAYAAEITPEPKPPLYEEVKDQLDADEVVKAEDLELDWGISFDVKTDFTKLEIPDKEKVKVTFEEAKNDAGEDFTTQKADTYKAVYYVEPTNIEHPKYQISRNLIVKEAPVTETVTESAPATDTGGDALSPVENAGTEPNNGDNGGTVSDSGEEDDEEADTQPSAEITVTPSETENGESELPAAEEPETPENMDNETANQETTEVSEETGDSETDTIDSEEEVDAEQTDETETEAESEAKEEGTYQVDIVDGEEYNITLNHEDGKYEAGETVEFSADLNGLPAVGTTMVEANEAENNADLMYSEVTYHSDSNTFTFEMPEDDINLAVALDSAENSIAVAAASDPWDEATEIEANTYYYYSDGTLHPFNSVMGSGGNDSYKYVRYKANGKTYTVNAYCMQHSMQSPPSGTTYKNMVELSEGGDDKYLRKALFYGYGGPGWGDTFNGYNIKSIMTKYGCTTETRAMQHYLVDYLYDGESGFGGALSTTAKNMLKEIKAALKQMPDPTAMELLPGLSTKATSKDTETFTWKANEAFKITIHLESGVSLVNETTGKTGTGSVTVKGGDKFHLTATTDKISSLKGNYKITSNYPLDFHAMLLKLASSQDIGFGYYTDSNEISLTVKWPEDATIEIVKKDKNTDANLSGAVYGVYSDAACTKLITKMPATDANGASKVTVTKTQNTVYLKEISVPTGYLIDASSYNINIEVGKTTKKTVKDTPVKASISLKKVDKDTGKAVAQGDATLKGAVYGLYARENITHPDGKTGVVYKAGDQVATLTTDEKGEASISNLYLGKYYIKEIAAPTGYLPDTEEHDLACDYEGNLTAEVKRECTSKETVVKQAFQIIKAAHSETDTKPLKGAGFSAYLVSSLKMNADGSYDFTNATPVVLTADGKTEMFTDEKGYACSIPLPYGKYVVRETTIPHNYKAVNDFIVTITENRPDEPQEWGILLDEEFKAKLKIVKKDDETKRTILAADTEFKVYDLDNKKYVEQVTTYPTTTTHKSYFTDSQGSLILPKNLKIGHYRIEEVTAPEGYTLNKNYVEITVDESTAYRTDETSGDVIIEVDYENTPVKGKLTIYKKGEMLTGFDKDFKYEERYLKGAEFNVYAAEDIYTPDYQKNEDGSRVLIYAKDTLVTTVTTDADGKAIAENLPLGSYYVKEKSAPAGFVLNTKSYEVTLAYADQNTPVVEAEVTVGDERQKVSITVEKQDAENNAVLAGAVFGIYSKDEIKNADGKVIVKADTLLQEITSDEKGQATCTLDLPLGQYYVKELKAPAGFVSSDETLEFDTSYQGQDVQTVTLKSVKKNEPTNVEITKSDITTGVELEGASLKVLDKDGNVIDEWTSVKDQPHVIKRLTVGEEYTLREELAPYGYLKATDVKFTVSDTAEVQKVEMKDEVPTGLLIINKKGEFLDKITLLDNAKGTVEHMFEYVTGSLSEVTFDVFAAEDIKAADGVSEDYFKADEKVGTITTDSTGIAQLDNLPAGKYYVKEVETAHGYVLDGEPRYIDLSYRDQDTPVITYDEKWQNARQKVKVTVLKKEKDSERMLAGGIFGLYAGEDIKNTSGEVLLEKDTLIEQKTTDTNGQITFNADLPMDGKYYVKEILAPDGFVTTGEVQEFTFEYAGAEQAEVSYDFTFENEATTVELTKTDLTTGKELPGAKLKVTDESGNVVDEWTSTEETHVIKELVVGKKYTMTETKPADGYVTAESITFTIENTAEIQKHEMKDDVTKVRISKTDIAGDQEIPEAKLTILDENDQVVESWTSGTDPHYIEKLPIGKYTLREEQAPKGYVLTSDVTFEVKDSEEVQIVTMKDDTVKGKVIVNKTDKTSGEPMKGVEFELRDSKGKVLETLKTDAAGHAESSLYEIASYKDGEYGKALKYYLVETKTLDGYTLDKTEHEVEFTYVDANTPTVEITFDLINEKTKTENPTNPSESSGDTGTSENAETHSDGTTTASSPKTGDTTNIWLPLLILAASGCAIAGIYTGRKHKKH